MCQKSAQLNILIYVAGLLKLICEFTITLLTASNGTSSMHAESGDTESSGGSGSIVIKYDVSI